MEEWENLLDQYPEATVRKDFENSLESAQSMIALDLAPFEIDWFLETLLVKPVGLLETISAKRNEDEWSRILTKAFSLLSELLVKFENMESYYEDVEKLCNLQYQALIRAKALSCLSELVKRHPPSEEAVRTHEMALALDDTCKAPRIELLGVICEYHPEAIPEVTGLWRTLINMLNSYNNKGKMSLTIVKSILHAVCGLFKNFGPDLVVSEVYEFYDKMVSYFNVTKCHEVCCTILERYSDLFAEKVSADAGLRRALWGTLSVKSRPALIAVYRTCFDSGGDLQHIASEVLREADSTRPLAKYTALRVLYAAREHTASLDWNEHADVQELQYRLETGISYDGAEAISWCIHAGVLHSDRLLQAAILHYDSLPASVAKRTVVHSLLTAADDVRLPAIVFLTSETCTAPDDAQRARYMSIWRGLLDSGGGADAIVLENSQRAVGDFMRHAESVLEAFLKEDAEEIPLHLSELLKLVAYVLENQETDVQTSSLTRIVLSCARRYGGTARAARMVLRGAGDEAMAFYKTIDVNNSEDEEHLLESCLALVEAPGGAVDGGEVLAAAKVLLSKTDSEPSILSKVLKKLEDLIVDHKELNKHKDELNKQSLSEVINLVEKVRRNNPKSSKDYRILHRDSLMFLGKFGTTVPCNNAHNANKVIGKNQEICLDIPAPDGAVVKLDLRGVLEEAIQAEDPEALQALISIVRANCPDAYGSSVLGRARAAIARRSGPASRAAPLCGSRDAAQLLPYIVKEVSPKARKVLLETLDTFLDQSVEGHEVVESVYAAAVELGNTSQTKLELLSTVIRAMKDNNLLAKTHLPLILISVLKTQLLSTHRVYKNAVDTFTDKLSLFEQDVLSQLVFETVDCLCDMETNAISKRMMGKAVAFLMKLYSVKEDLPDAIDVFCRAAKDWITQNLFVLSALRGVYNCDLALSREILFRIETLVNEVLDFEVTDEKEIDAILDFVGAFSDVLLELYYEKTLKTISKLIENATPEQINYAHKNLSTCLFAITRTLRNTPQVLYKSFSIWYNNLPITISIENLMRREDKDHSHMVNALLNMMKLFDLDKCVFEPQLRNACRQWLRCVRQISVDLNDGFVERNLAYLKGLVRACLMVLLPGDVESAVFGDDKENVLPFCRTYKRDFSEFFMKNRSILLQKNWAEFSVILNDIVQDCAIRHEEGDLMLLVNELWPIYELKSSFKEKYALMIDLLRLNPSMSQDSKPVRWLTRTLVSDASMDEKIRLIALVPGGEVYSSTYRQFATCLPTRLSELTSTSAAALRALLDNWVVTRDRALLDILAALADGDSTKSWWDAAFEASAREVGSSLDLSSLQHVHQLSCGARGYGVCERLLIPMLRHASRPVCLQFFSASLPSLLDSVAKQPRQGAALRKCALEYGRAFKVLQLAFEKITKQHLESPDSPLYSGLAAKCDKPYFIVRRVCECVEVLRTRMACPPGADRVLADAIRLYHCAAFNCMATAICFRAPRPHFYSPLFQLARWRSVVDGAAVYKLPIAAEWKQQNRKESVSIDMSDGEHALLTAGTRTRTVHFLRTLSEDPFLYDIPEVDESATTQELRLHENPLNHHECAPTLTALFCHVATFDDHAWRDALCSALDGGHGDEDRNVRWLLAQIVCNCKEELRPHATVLRPALLNLILTTTLENKLNELHVEILNNLIYWREEVNELPLQSQEVLNGVIKSLILTVKHHGSNQSTLSYLLDKLDKLAQMYAQYIVISEELFDTAGSGGGDRQQVELKVLKTLAKNKVDMSAVIHPILEQFGRHSLVDAELSRLVGLALAAGSDASAARARALVSRLRARNIGDYVKAVYYIQLGYPRFCDDNIIRDIVELVNKVPTRERQRCLDVVAGHLAQAGPGERVDELFDTLDISQLVSNGDGMGVARCGLGLMGAGLRARVARQLAGCARADRLAGDALLTALEVTLSAKETEEPPAKRPAIVSWLLTSEVQCLLAPLGRLLREREAVARVAACLASDRAVRFCEAFVIAVCQPAMSRERRVVDPAWLALDLFFHRPRPPGSKRTPLTDEKVTPSNESMKYPVPVEDVLETVLEFAKTRPRVSTELCARVACAVRSVSTSAELADRLLVVLQRDPKPLPIVVARMLVDACCHVDGFAAAVNDLLSTTRGTEGRGSVAALQQEMRLRCAGSQQFVLGQKNEDSEMSERKTTFSINELVASFEMLSNWQENTIQQKKDISSRIPVLWTDEPTFEASLGEYKGGVAWFDALLSCVRDAPGHEWSRRLARLDAWPRNKFDLSAVSEAIHWHHIQHASRCESDLRMLRGEVGLADCLAKWAARLMLRRLLMRKIYVESDMDSNEGEERSLRRSLSLSNQLEWCRRANQMGLPMLALQCLEDVPELYESETLRWLAQKMAALRAIGACAGRSHLERALSLYSSVPPEILGLSSLEDIMSAEYWRLVIIKDMDCFSLGDWSRIRAELDRRDLLVAKVISSELKETLNATFDVVMACLWEHRTTDNYQVILKEMSGVLRLYVLLDLGQDTWIHADVLLASLDGCTCDTLSEDVSTAVLEALNIARETLDEFALDLLRKNQRRLPTAPDRAELFARDSSLEECKLMLSLVCVPRHTLQQYCRRLLRASEDGDVTSWQETFRRMKAKIFENPYAGADFKVLYEHRSALYSIEDYYSCTVEIRHRVLSDIANARRGEERETLRLGALCPALVGCRTGDRALSELLRVPHAATIQFDEKVSIFTDSIRHAALLTVRVSGAGDRRYIVKSGEPLKTDAAALRCGRLAGGAGYWVTPLLEDCGLIEYLEDHERLRSLIGCQDLARGDGQNNRILLPRSAAVAQFNQDCANVPAHLLRCAIENGSSSTEDFLAKQERFTETLSVITAVNWLLGVGDRHLNNTMYDHRTGGLCNIDWGALLQHGRGELPCARLTRNVLAVCDPQVLESSLQRVVERMRDKKASWEAVLRVSFGWMDDVADQLSHSLALLKGAQLSYHVTRNVLERSSVKHKEKYIELLDEVLAEYTGASGQYTVEEQVSCLLRQSTDPRILAVTRDQWEPWV